MEHESADLRHCHTLSYALLKLIRSESIKRAILNEETYREGHTLSTASSAPLEEPCEIVHKGELLYVVLSKGFGANELTVVEEFGARNRLGVKAAIEPQISSGCVYKVTPHSSCILKRSR